MDKTNSRSSHPRATPCRYIAALSSQRTVLISRSLLQLTKCGGACIHTFHSFCSRNQLIAAFVFCCYLHLEIWFLLSRHINVISYFLVPPVIHRFRSSRDRDPIAERYHFHGPRQGVILGRIVRFYKYMYYLEVQFNKSDGTWSPLYLPIAVALYLTVNYNRVSFSFFGKLRYKLPKASK